MKILVTGASGFVGSHLLRRLSGSGHQIVALSRTPDSAGRDTRFTDVDWIAADLAHCQDFSFAKGVSCVYHLAGVSFMDGSAESLRVLNDVNVVATERLARACHAHGVPRFLFVSSVAACEVAAGPEVHEGNGRPVSAYGKSKRRAEEALIAMHCEDFAVTVLRPTALFGEMHRGSMYELARVIRDGRLVLFGDGCNRTNFYYIGDFISALLAAGNDSKSHGKIYIAADRPLQLRELVRFISEAVGVPSRYHSVPAVLGRCAGVACDVLRAVFKVNLPLSSRRVAAMVRDVAYCNDRLVSELAIMPATGVRDGVMRSVAWYREAGLL
jgi:nucleoside-diphosphate-sugar epimerase